MASPARFLDVDQVGSEVNPKSLFPKPVLKLFMKFLRLGIVADTKDQHSSASARAIAGAKARPARGAVEIRDV